MFHRLEAMEERFLQLERDLSNPEVASDVKRLTQVSKERAQLEPAILLFRDYRKKEQSFEEAKEILESGDSELEELAQEEITTLEPELEKLREELRMALLPKDPYDEKDIVVEIRAGAGGAEACLFVSDLLTMYSKFAEGRGWRPELVSLSETDLGGYREVVFTIKGERVYSLMKHESGVHRVQRVPQTETQGRIHTSTATVAVLPEADEIDVDLNENEIRVDTFCSSGPGGQSVNTTKSAIRLTHEPTGLVVSCQDEKSQIKNKAKAMKVLRSRLLALEIEKSHSERAAARKGQIGSGDRSERIRTYNFPQGRVSDHRINLTVYNLPEILQGRLQEVLEALQHAEQEALLQELGQAEGL